MTMPTSTKNRPSSRKGLTHYAIYAPIGAGEVVVEKTREASVRALKLAQERRRDVMKGYYDLARRGEKLVSSVRRSAYTRRAVEQAKLARSQMKAAATSVRKTAGATGKAAKSAAKKVG
jgi:hypothetical protein